MNHATKDKPAVNCSRVVPRPAQTCWCVVETKLFRLGPKGGRSIRGTDEEMACNKC